MLGLEFSSGKLEYYERVDIRTAAEIAAGSKPKEALALDGWTYYGDRMASFTRVYEALGADQRFDRIVRVPEDTPVSPGMYVIINGQQFRIQLTSAVIVKSSIRAMELTLVKLEERYDLVTVET